MNAKRVAILAASITLTAAAALAQSDRRSAYTYVRESSGDVTVVSGLNGEVEARRNLPISAGDEVRTDEPGRVEIALADGNILHVGGGTQVQFVSLYGQQGSDDQVSALSLKEGSIILAVVGSDENAVPRIDTEDATVYTSSGSRVRVNSDPRHGTAVVVRAGSVEVRSRAGSYTVRAGNYLLVQGDEEPEIARGSFSRDRFDIWASDRLEVAYEAPRSTSSQYVGEDYASDVSSLDGYGNWDYNTTYSSYVWRPTVAAGWTPYSYGSWYYTPIGLTWWSSDPWGWYPFHYGNWFFDAGWNSWCWSPGYLYSPAWVYWGFTPSYVGWCPIGWYGPYYSPWWNTYYKTWTYPRTSLAFAINGNFSTRRVDFRGWNFTGATNLGATRGRLTVVPGTRVADRLGGQVAISSRPIVVNARGSGGVREGLREFVREAPRAIERSSGRDAALLEPVLARDRTLPQSTVEALRERTVVAERGRLTGPGAMDLAPRGSTVVERGKAAEVGGGTTRIVTDRATGRTVITDRKGSTDMVEQGRAAGVPDSGARNETRRPEARPADRQDSWRGRPGEPGKPASDGERGRSSAPLTIEPGRESGRAPTHEGTEPRAAHPAAEDWRSPPSRPESVPGRSTAPPRPESADRREDWRSRSDVPPARRVIEGAVPSHRPPESGYSPRDSSAHDHGYSAPQRDSAPRSIDRAPAPQPQRSAPQPQMAAPRSAPPPQAAPPSHSSPPPSRSAPAAPSGGSRSAPPPSSGKPGRS